MSVETVPDPARSSFPNPPASGPDRPVSGRGEFEAAVAEANKVKPNKASAANPAATPAPSSKPAAARGTTQGSHPKPASATPAPTKRPAAQPSNGARPSLRNPAAAAKTTPAVTTPDEQPKQIDHKQIDQKITGSIESLPTVVSQEVPLVAEQGIVTATYDLANPKEKPTNDPSVLYKRFYEAKNHNDFSAAYSNAIQYIEKFESSKQFDPIDKYYRTVVTWLSTSALQTMYANVRAASTDVGGSYHWSSQTLQLAGLCKRFEFLSPEQKKYVDGFIERAGSWKQRLERNSNMTIDVSDWTASRKNPTHAEIAERIAAAMGYDRRMMEAYARAHGKQDANEAFFHFLSGDKNAQIAQWMDESRKNGTKSATVWELNSGTFEYAKRWLNAYKQTESAVSRYEAALKQSADPAERKELSEQVARMKAQLNGERPLIEKEKFDQYWMLHQLILEIQHGPLPAVQAGADWVLDKLEKVSRPVQFLSTAIAGTQWAILTREAAVLRDNKMSRRLAEHKYTPAAILDAAAERFWTGKVKPGFEQPVAELYKAAVEEYGDDPETAVHQFFYTVLEVGTDPTNWGLAELAALRVIGKVGKVTRIARVEGRLAEEVAAGARLGDDAVRKAGVRPNGKAPELVHSGTVADDAVESADDAVKAAAAERNNTARLNPSDKAAESVGKGRIGAGAGASAAADVAREVEWYALNGWKTADIRGLEGDFATCTRAALDTSLKLSRRGIEHNLAVYNAYSDGVYVGRHAVVEFPDGHVVTYGRVFKSKADLEKSRGRTYTAKFRGDLKDYIARQSDKTQSTIGGIASYPHQYTDLVPFEPYIPFEPGNAPLQVGREFDLAAPKAPPELGSTKPPLGGDLPLAVQKVKLGERSPSVLARADTTSNHTEAMKGKLLGEVNTAKAGGDKIWSIAARLKNAGGPGVGLPTTERIRFIPQEGYNPKVPLPRGPNKGFLDRFGNEWVKGPSRTAREPAEWDVQLSQTGKSQLGWASREGRHLNVSLKGEITH